jgi:hypothetical protein
MFTGLCRASLSFVVQVTRGNRLFSALIPNLMLPLDFV